MTFLQSVMICDAMLSACVDGGWPTILFYGIVMRRMRNTQPQNTATLTPLSQHPGLQ